MSIRQRARLNDLTARWRRGPATAVAVLLLAGTAAPAAAGRDDQSTPPAPAQAAPVAPKAPPPGQRGAPPAQPAAPAGPAIGLYGFGHAGYTSFAAADSFEAVLGSSSGPVWGGGAMVTFGHGRFFAQASLERFSDEGERVFVSDGEVFPLGIPLSVEVTPIEFTAGYRFVPRPRRARTAPPPPRAPEIFKPANPQAGTTSARSAPPPPPRVQPASTRSWVPYLGGGFGLLGYKESSSIGGDTEEIDESFTSYHVVGGVDVRLSRWFGVGVEAAYRWEPDALGEAGVSAEFGDDDLGGPTIRVRVIVGR
jgi:hypothetical protein